MSKPTSSPPTDQGATMSCDCEYPCSCVRYDRRWFGSWRDVTRFLERRLEQSVKTNKTIHTALARRNRNLARDVVDRDLRVAELEHSLTEAQEDIDNWKRTTFSRGDEIEALASKVHGLQSANDILQRDWHSDADEIEALEAKVHRLVSAIKLLENKGLIRASARIAQQRSDRLVALNAAIKDHRDTPGAIYTARDMKLYQDADISYCGANVATRESLVRRIEWAKANVDAGYFRLFGVG